MCFEHLPIVFDGTGRARLDPDGTFELENGPRRPDPPPSRSDPPDVRDFDIDPVTRVAGALAFHTRVDLQRSVVEEAYSQAVMFRGYELILRGRDPEEAIEISSRACGVCGGVHSTCSAMALEMVNGVAPPPLGLIGRNLAEAAELLYDHCLHLFLLAGPDYSEEVVGSTNPELLRRAESTRARHAGVHGFSTVADIMEALNPLRGRLTATALDVTRWGREVISLVYGKYPHPSAVLPGGLSTRLDAGVVNQVLARSVRLLDFAKRAVTVWEDIVEFFLEADPAYAAVGERPANMVTLGIWDDPEVYDASFLRADEWGRARLSTPGIVVDGELRTTSLQAINLGIEEFVEHSFYEQWAGDEVERDPAASPLSPFHPWNKRTLPKPEARGWRDRYSWSTAPRWDRLTMESGPLARQWVTASVGEVRTEFIDSGGGSLRAVIPEGELPEQTFEWRVPERVNALERNRARAFHVGYCLVAAYSYLLRALDLIREGETETSVPYEPHDGIGVGFWEAGRGALLHYADVRDGRLANYQILTPSTWMASPRDPWGGPGPYEEAVTGTPILERSEGRDGFSGVDILRAVRSFDPCLPCAVHLHTAGGTVVRDATTCACGVDG